MSFLVLGISLFAVFLSALLLLMPRTTAVALLRQATKPTQVRPELPLWRTAIDVDRMARPFTLFRSLFANEPDPKLAERLSLAGFDKPAHADIFSGSRLAIPAILGLFVSLFVKQDTITAFLFALMFGFFAPDFWLSSAIKRRRNQIRLSLPDALDFLAICLEAGLGIDQGIARVAQELRISHPELSDELQRISFEQRAGVPRLAAWQAFADRSQLESVRSFVSMLIQTDRFGTAVSKSLGAFSDSLRLQRMQKTEEAAAKTTIKLVPPLVFFVFPSVIIVTAGPALMAVMKNLNHLLK
jgi:tight adherence protein C